MMGIVQVCSQCRREVEVYCLEHPEVRVEIIHIEQATHLQTCSHCGQTLSAVNIRLALEDIGGGLAIDKITLCCPGHTEDAGCPRYRDEDGKSMAYWYMR
jgi:hypothetical protein